MKAWVLESPRSLVLREILKPAPGPDEVLVKIAYVGLCGSDVEIYHGRRAPESIAHLIILGHEACGVIESAGERVSAFQQGDHVVMRGIWGCCAEYVKAVPLAPPNASGSRFCQLIKLPVTLPLKGASLLEVLPKILMSADLVPITTATDVLIIGQGVCGLLLTQALNLKSPHKLVAVDTFEEKLELARRFGATHTICSNLPDWRERLAKILPDGADIVIPAHLSGEGVAESIELLKWRGKIVLWGCLGKAPVDFFRLHARGGDILSTQMNNLATDAHYCELAVRYLSRGLIDVQPLTTHVFDFDRLPEAFKLKEEFHPDVVHVLVRAGGESKK